MISFSTVFNINEFISGVIYIFCPDANTVFVCFSPQAFHFH